MTVTCKRIQWRCGVWPDSYLALRLENIKTGRNHEWDHFERMTSVGLVPIQLCINVTVIQRVS